VTADDVLVHDDHVGGVFTYGVFRIVRGPSLRDDGVTRLAEEEANEATFERATVCDDGARL
jgi:hypothetical protein